MNNLKINIWSTSGVITPDVPPLVTDFRRNKGGTSGILQLRGRQSTCVFLKRHLYQRFYVRILNCSLNIHLKKLCHFVSKLKCIFENLKFMKDHVKLKFNQSSLAHKLYTHLKQLKSATSELMDHIDRSSLRLHSEFHPLPLGLRTLFARQT